MEQASKVSGGQIISLSKLPGIDAPKGFEESSSHSKFLLTQLSFLQRS